MMVTVERLAVGAGMAPEDVVFDAEGRLYGGMRDGRILRFQSDGTQPEVFAEIVGRPLGLQFDTVGNLMACIVPPHAIAPDGSLIPLIPENTTGKLVVDVGRVFSITPEGSITVLTPEEAEGIPIECPNNLDIGADGTIYFTNCTTSAEQYTREIVEGQPAPNGHLLACDPSTQTTRVLLDGLWFANGVAVSPDGSFVLVAESTKYRVTRYWLRGSKRGTSDRFIEDLPGLPDNISCNGRDLFWIASPVPVGSVFGLDLEGHLTYHLDVLYPSGEAYTWVTGVVEHEGMLYLANLQDDAIGRVPIPSAA
jgi:sugar lactone lactonase YvrE